VNIRENVSTGFFLQLEVDVVVEVEAVKDAAAGDDVDGEIG
jgi:hypothetical protein